MCAQHIYHSSDSRRCRRRSDIYIDAGRIVISSSSTSPGRRERDRRRRDCDPKRERERVKAEIAGTAEAAATGHARTNQIPIFHRATTMPTYETRGRRPLIVEELVQDESSAAVPIGVDILQHSSRPQRSRRNDSDGSPGYALGEEESHSRTEQRRRLWDDMGIQGTGSDASSAPVPRTHDALYGSSHGTSYGGSSRGLAAGSGFTRVKSSPAAKATIKKVRWADPLRREQNERIAARPKLDRSTSVRNPELQVKVKSILKNGDSGSGNNTGANTLASATPARAPFTSMSRPTRTFRDYLDRASDSLSSLALDSKKLEDLDRPARRLTPHRYSTFGSDAGSRPRTEVWYFQAREPPYGSDPYRTGPRLWGGIRVDPQ